MTCPSIVRVARGEDLNEVWRLFLQGYRENGLFTLAPEKVDFFVGRALFPHLIPANDTGPRGLIGVIGDIGKLEALCFVMLDTYWYTHDRHIGEYLVYVDPECRRSYHVRSLIAWMKEQSDRTRLPLLSGIISNERTDAKVRLYRRMLPPIGAFFLYDPTKNATASISSSSTIAA